MGLGIVALFWDYCSYANSFVMKNRSKELGLYSVLGLEKRHLFSMILKETVILGFCDFASRYRCGGHFHDKLSFTLFLQRLIGESTGFGFDLSK